MVEAGVTRAKNAGNIIMKNLMDFCIGTVVFILLGYGIMNSENYIFGLIGMPEYQMFTNFYDFNWSNFFFQLVFCATAATIVSGAMAERTKFLAYCVYSGVISAVIYPIEAGWVWNGQGWLVGLGYVDFAGSSVIHMVGGLSALVGAWMLGPRLGKYTKEKDGTLRVNAIPGHSLTLGNTTLASAYADFLPAAPGALGGDFAYEPVDVGSLTPVTLPTAPAAGHRRHRHDGEPGDGLRRSDGQGGPVPRRQDEHAPAAQAPGGHCGGQGGPGPGGGGRRAGAAHRQPGGRQDLPYPRGQRGEGTHRRNG